MNEFISQPNPLWENSEAHWFIILQWVEADKTISRRRRRKINRMRRKVAIAKFEKQIYRS